MRTFLKIFHEHFQREFQRPFYIHTYIHIYTHVRTYINISNCPYINSILFLYVISTNKKKKRKNIYIYNSRVTSHYLFPRYVYRRMIRVRVDLQRSKIKTWKENRVSLFERKHNNTQQVVAFSRLVSDDTRLSPVERAEERTSQRSGSQGSQSSSLVSIYLL